MRVIKGRLKKKNRLFRLSSKYIFAVGTETLNDSHYVFIKNCTSFKRMVAKSIIKNLCGICKSKKYYDYISDQFKGDNNYKSGQTVSWSCIINYRQKMPL